MFGYSIQRFSNIFRFLCICPLYDHTEGNSILLIGKNCVIPLITTNYYNWSPAPVSINNLSLLYTHTCTRVTRVSKHQFFTTVRVTWTWNVVVIRQTLFVGYRYCQIERMVLLLLLFWVKQIKWMVYYPPEMGIDRPTSEVRNQWP